MHIPVLLHEVLEALNPQPGEFIIDGTLGAGGHAREIVNRITPGGTLFAVDRDPRAVAAFTQSYVPPETVRIVTASASYAALPRLLVEHKLPKADGLLLDLGFSSEQLGAGPSAGSGQGGALAGRGFSFTADEPLLMTYDDETPSVATLLAELSEEDLAGIIREYGEERYSAQIAHQIAQTAKNEGIGTTGKLVAAIKKAVPEQYERGRLHPATRTFQALRIYANAELRQLETLLQELPAIVKAGGRVAIISFHSLEDRIVKQYFRRYRAEHMTSAAYLSARKSRVRDGGKPYLSGGCITPLAGGGSVGGGQEYGPASAGELPNPISAPNMHTGSGVITATEAESKSNPRSRSAKLRIFTLP